MALPFNASPTKNQQTSTRSADTIKYNPPPADNSILYQKIFIRQHPLRLDEPKIQTATNQRSIESA
jgi:hypothetical protein